MNSNKNNPAPGQADSAERTEQVKIPLLPGEIKEVVDVVRRFPLRHVIVLGVFAGLAGVAFLMLWHAANLNLLSLIGSLMIAVLIFAYGVVAFRAAKTNGTTTENHRKETAQPGDADRSA